ncbi:MAG: hypothetical protein U0414_36270 [Polyangiaceae bacterium]
MASLLFKLFQTMPLSPALEQIRPTGHYLGDISGLISCAIDPVNYGYNAPKPTEDDVDHANEGDTLPIWSWDLDTLLAAVTNIRCRVRGDEFKQYVVLNQLDFGCTPSNEPTGFARSVRVERAGREFELPLEERFRLSTFATSGMWQQWHANPLFPLESRHDPSFVVAYAYDIVPVTGEVISLRDDDHPEKAAVDDLLTTCLMLNTIKSDDERDAFRSLFADDLWHPSPVPDASMDPVIDAASMIPGLGAVVGDAVQTLGISPTRVLVALCFTVCRERDDYVPGHILGMGVVGMGRLYPHIMVVATDPLERVHTAIRFRRPPETEIVGGHVCGCGEMLTDIGSGLWTDANEGNEMGHPLGAPPLPFWNNIFNYFLPDPDVHPATSGRRISMVRHELGPREVVDTGLVERVVPAMGSIFPTVYPERSGRITKVARQAGFDNVHLAPRMRVRQPIATAITPRPSAPAELARTAFTTNEEWKMDRIVMAPFCAHDCFHLHARWTGVVGEETHVFGWSASAPYSQPEAPMVPPNHDVDIFFMGPNAFMYIDTAFDAPTDLWQVACYPGAGYALTARAAVGEGKTMTATDDEQWFEDSKGSPLGGWALFYWKLRYYFVLNDDGTFDVRERVAVHDPAKAMDV